MRIHSLFALYGTSTISCMTARSQPSVTLLLSIIVVTAASVVVIVIVVIVVVMVDGDGGRW